MITLLHLSDIHFSPRDDLSQFDLDQQIRRALVEDFQTKPADGADYDGILITGDIAFAGKHENYVTAQEWLDDVFKQTGTSAADTYVIPGNHDVDRDYVQPDLPLWESHVRLRQDPNPIVWRDLIAKQLQRDPLHTMLAPLKAYNDFAQGYDCRTTPDQLTWYRVFPKKFDDGRAIRLHGINSALISDQGDAPGQLLVSDFQTSHLKHSDGLVDVILCHHPPEWLMDKAAVRDALRTFAPVALFGHEHSTRIAADTKQIQLFAGAVQPSRRDPGDWLPTYHILQLVTGEQSTGPRLTVKIHTREYDKQNFCFRPRRDENDQPFEEHRLDLRRSSRAPLTLPSADLSPAALSKMPTELPTIEDSMPTTSDSSQRDLLVHFFRLRTPDRYAKLPRKGQGRFPAGKKIIAHRAKPPRSDTGVVVRRSHERRTRQIVYARH